MLCIFSTMRNLSRNTTNLWCMFLDIQGSRCIAILYVYLWTILNCPESCIYNYCMSVDFIGNCTLPIKISMICVIRPSNCVFCWLHWVKHTNWLKESRYVMVNFAHKCLNSDTEYKHACLHEFNQAICATSILDKKQRCNSFDYNFVKKLSHIMLLLGF